jgi:hypothetical protein
MPAFVDLVYSFLGCREYGPEKILAARLILYKITVFDPSDTSAISPEPCHA